MVATSTGTTARGTSGASGRGSARPRRSRSTVDDALLVRRGRARRALPRLARGHALPPLRGLSAAASLPPVRYQFVDCRWELGNPGRGRELYLAGHIPGASFLDVETELSAPPASSRRAPPAPGGVGLRGGGLSRRDRAGRLRRRATTAAWTAALRGSGGSCATSGTTTSPCSPAGSARGSGRCAAGEEEIEPERFEPRPREDDTISAEELERRLGEPGLVVVDARAAGALPRRDGADRPGRGPHPGRGERAVRGCASCRGAVLEAEEIVVYCGSGVTACVDLLALARRRSAGREALPRLVERLVEPRPSGRDRLGGGEQRVRPGAARPEVASSSPVLKDERPASSSGGLRPGRAVPTRSCDSRAVARERRASGVRASARRPLARSRDPAPRAPSSRRR